MLAQALGCLARCRGGAHVENYPADVGLVRKARGCNFQHDGKAERRRHICHVVTPGAARARDVETEGSERSLCFPFGEDARRAVPALWHAQLQGRGAAAGADGACKFQGLERLALALQRDHAGGEAALAHAR